MVLRRPLSRERRTLAVARSAMETLIPGPGPWEGERAADPPEARPPLRRDERAREREEHEARGQGAPGGGEARPHSLMNPRRLEKPNWKTPMVVSRRSPTSKVRSMGTRSKPS